MSEVQSAQNYKERIKNSVEAAESYTHRKQRKHEAEMTTIRRALSCLDGVETFLDAPCGTGRATIMLARLGYKATGADLGEAAVNVARRKVMEAGVSAKIDRADIEHLPYPDGAFDAVLCFRLYHHFPDDQVRRRVVAALCRVSRKYVVISYFSPLSPTSIRRWLKTVLFNKPSRQVATSLSSITKLFLERDYRLVKDIPQRRFLNTLHLAVFELNE